MTRSEAISTCRFCRQPATERHHVFSGPYRKASEKHGYTIMLCHCCHNEPPDGVHYNKLRRFLLRREAQTDFELTHTREEFMTVFGRNYL